VTQPTWIVLIASQPPGRLEKNNLRVRTTKTNIEAEISDLSNQPVRNWS